MFFVLILAFFALFFAGLWRHRRIKRQYQALANLLWPLYCAKRRAPIREGFTWFNSIEKKVYRIMNETGDSPVEIRMSPKMMLKLKKETSSLMYSRLYVDLAATPLIDRIETVGGSTPVALDTRMGPYKYKIVTERDRHLEDAKEKLRKEMASRIEVIGGDGQVKTFVLDAVTDKLKEVPTHPSRQAPLAYLGLDFWISNDL